MMMNKQKPKIMSVYFDLHEAVDESKPRKAGLSL